MTFALIRPVVVVVLVGLAAGGCSSGDDAAGKDPDAATAPVDGPPDSSRDAGTPDRSAGGEGGLDAATVDAPNDANLDTIIDAMVLPDATDVAAADGTGSDAAGVASVVRVAPSAGCGSDPGQALGTPVRFTIETMGSKAADAADSKKGPWSYPRTYFVTLPAGYNRHQAYPLIFQASGCGAKGAEVYALDNAVADTSIRVTLIPPPDEIGHATNPNQGCFDDKEGDDSVEWVFYETLYDRLAGELCFDRNRVFALGNSSGGWLANELACKYAGDASRPIRAMMSNGAGLPTDPHFTPTCSDKPSAMMWINELNDTGSSGIWSRPAIMRAMKANKCTIGSGYDNTSFDDFPIGGGNARDTCKTIQGCPSLYPLVVCILSRNGNGSNEDVANPGFSTFIRMFSSPPLAAP